MESFLQAKAARAVLDSELADCSAAMAKFPRGPLGLTPDSVKFSAEYRTAAGQYAAAFARSRAFNAKFVKAFKIELRNERNARRS